MIEEEISKKAHIKKRSTESLVLQERDFAIFIWLLDQKFSDLEILKKRFFDPTSESFGGVRTRIQKLLTRGYLKSQHLDVGSTKKYYVATAKAQRETQKKYPNIRFPKALEQVSSVTFPHDRYVLLSRMHLEDQKRATNWKSERRLKSLLASSGYSLEREFMSDGLFTNRNGEVCAFELENTPKNFEKYHRKISRFIDIMESANPAFRLCYYVTTSEATKSALRSLTSPYPKKFLIQTFDELASASESPNQATEVPHAI